MLLFFRVTKKENTYTTPRSAYGNKQVLVLLAALYIKQTETYKKKNFNKRVLL